MKTKYLIMFLIFLILTSSLSYGFAAAAVSSSGDKVITDIVHWNHPVKTVFQRYKVAIFKLILQQNNTYPVFFVRFPERLNQNTVQQYRVIIEKVAFANAFWDYKLVDAQQNLTVEVICNRKERSLQNVVINVDARYYHRLLQGEASSGNNSDRVFDYLLRKVPEIEAYRRMIEAAKADQNDAAAQMTLIMRLDGEPDPENSDVYLRDYYSVYIGEKHDDHTVRWRTFLIKKDLSAILVDDQINGEYLTLEDWRRKEPHEQ